APPAAPRASSRTPRPRPRGAARPGRRSSSASGGRAWVVHPRGNPPQRTAQARHRRAATQASVAPPAPPPEGGARSLAAFLAAVLAVEDPLRFGRGVGALALVDGALQQRAAPLPFAELLAHAGRLHPQLAARPPLP